MPSPLTPLDHSPHFAAHVGSRGRCQPHISLISLKYVFILLFLFSSSLSHIQVSARSQSSSYFREPPCIPGRWRTAPSRVKRRKLKHIEAIINSECRLFRIGQPRTSVCACYVVTGTRCSMAERECQLVQQTSLSTLAWSDQILQHVFIVLDA